MKKVGQWTWDDKVTPSEYLFKSDEVEGLICSENNVRAFVKELHCLKRIGAKETQRINNNPNYDLKYKQNIIDTGKEL